MAKDEYARYAYNCVRFATLLQFDAHQAWIGLRTLQRKDACFVQPDVYTKQEVIEAGALGFDKVAGPSASLQQAKQLM